MEPFSRLNALLKLIISSGAHEAGTRSKVRSIQLTNAIALITAFLFFTLVTYMIIRNGWSTVSLVGLLTIAALSGVIVLNRFNLYNLSRGFISIITPLAVLAAILLPRITLIGQYAHFR